MISSWEVVTSPLKLVPIIVSDYGIKSKALKKRLPTNWNSLIWIVKTLLDELNLWVLRHYLTNWRMKTLWFFSHEKNSWWPRIWKIPSVKLGESLEKMCLVFHALQSELWDLLSHLGHVSFPFKWVSWVVGITYMDRTSHFSFCLSLSKYHIALKNKRKWK